jgi:hypothetical protein
MGWPGWGVVVVLPVEHPSVPPYLTLRFQLALATGLTPFDNCPSPAFKVHSLGRGQGLSRLSVLRTKHLTIGTALPEILKELG